MYLWSALEAWEPLQDAHNLLSSNFTSRNFTETHVQADSLQYGLE